MSLEEDIQKQLTEKFSFLDGKVKVQRARRLWVDVPYEHFMQVFNFSVKELSFTVMATITGLDEGENIGVIYHIARMSGEILNLKTAVPKTKPVVQTVSDMFPAADLYERELVDLLGVKVEGLPEGHRYPLPEDWPAGQYPLRKDWTAEMLKQQAADEQK